MKQLVGFCLIWLLVLKSQYCEAVQRFDDTISLALVEKGKHQLHDLEEKSHLPRYGECWLHALEHLRNGCRMLTDTIQVDLALHFTDCFLEMSGHDRLDCVSERTEALKRLCMSEMSDRSFAVYTEFFTQTQSMCFFLQSQLWQMEADLTIDRLRVRSKEVSEQLQVASGIQQSVLEHQKEGLKLQADMLKVGGYLAKTLNGSQEVLDRLTADLKNSTNEHQAILKELFREFYLLHSWIVGRYAFVDRVVFYVCLLSLVMVATSTRRTTGARSYLILNSLGSLLLEVSLPHLLPFMDEIQKDRTHWAVRKLFGVFGFVIFVYFCCRYRDEHSRLLNEIKEQNRQIMESVLRMKMEAALPVPKQESDDKYSYSTVYTFAESRVSNTQQSGHRGPRSLLIPMVSSPLREPESTDYDQENSSNERRSASKSIRREARAPSRTSESSVSHTSRYNLRRKTMAN